MMFAGAVRGIHVNPVLVRAMDRIFILHADHEQNASHLHRPCACAARRHQPVRGHRRGRRMPGGPAHGGANEALTMLEGHPAQWRRREDPSSSNR